MKLYAIFGLPGAGKTFIGQILKKDFGFYLYEGDQDMPPELKTALEKQEAVNDELRDAFFEKLINSIKQLLNQHENIVVTQTFIKEKYREQFLQAFPQASFILVEANDVIREERLVKRKEWQLDLEYWRNMATLFEQPQIPHQTILNNNGEEEVKKQIHSLSK